MKPNLFKKIPLILLFITTSVLGQKIETDIHQNTLLDFIKIEKKIKSKRISNSSNHISTSGNAQPIKFLRKEKKIPDLVVYYFFKEKDSTMSYILYEWDEKTTNSTTDSVRKSKKFQKRLRKKYNRLKKRITRLYGESKSTGNLKDLKQTNNVGGLRKKDIWKPNDSTEIEMYTVMSNYYLKKGLTTITPTHRIRLYIRNHTK